MDYAYFLAKFRQKINTLFLSCFWLLPFISSLVGFQCIKWFTQTTLVTTPSVLGMPIAQAVVQLADQGLNVRILKEKEDNSVNAGMVISQNPRPQETIKKQQSVFLVITKHAPKPQAPDIVSMQESKGIYLAQSKGFKIKNFTISSHLPAGTILAQAPNVGQSDEHNELLFYVSGEKTKYRIMPSLLYQTHAAAEAFLKEYGIKTVITSTVQEESSQAQPDKKVIMQNPAAGQIIDLAQLTKVTLTLS